jgi:hypothetical protein
MTAFASVLTFCQRAARFLNMDLTESVWMQSFLSPISIYHNKCTPYGDSYTLETLCQKHFPWSAKVLKCEGKDFSPNTP